MVKAKSSKIISEPEVNSVVPVSSSPDFRKADMNKVLDQYQKWIFTLVQRQIPHYLVPAEQLADEIDDLVQTTLITFWLRLASEREPIVSPEAYIRSIVRSRCV